MADRLLIIGVSLAVGIALGSCDRFKSPMPELQQPPAASTAPAPTEGERRAFAQSAQKEIDELRAGIAELRTRADQASQETRAKLGLELDLLENQLREVQQKLVDLGSATVDTWVALKETFKKALEQLKSDLGSYRKNAV